PDAPGASGTATPASGTPPATPGAPTRTAGRLTLSWWTDVGFPSPFAFSNLGPGGVVRLNLLFDTLTWKDERGIIPWLAERWEVAGDGLGYTFRLRPGIRWHDGRDLTADDVAFSFGYYRQHPFKWAATDMVERAEPVDPRTVAIRLARPFAPFLEDVAGVVPIIPRHVWEPVADPIKFLAPQAALGSGPYTLTSYKEGAGEYLLRANPDYFRGRPLVDELAYLLVPQAQNVVALQQRAADAALSTEYDVAATFGKGPAYRALATPPFSIVRLVFNVDRPPFDRAEFRRAIAYGLDRRQIGERVVHGDVVVGSAGVVPPESPWHHPGVRAYPYDPDRARATLDGLGYRDADGDGRREGPDGRPLTLDLLTDPAAPDAEIVATMLRAIGLEVRLITGDAKARNEQLRSLRYGMALVSHIGVGGDPDFLRRWYAGQVYNSFEYGNVLHSPEFTRLADEQVRELDPARRRALVARLQEILAEELPTLPLYHRRFYWVHDPAKWDRWANTWGGMMNGIPLLDNKLAFLPPAPP
ncbi:MAG: ABC transporter substrate-binding protein, partial [Chloroflexota bacterium]|nr:ABC transporter substrate-binding protein [Chloroflexota bacterium]